MKSEAEQKANELIKKFNDNFSYCQEPRQQSIQSAIICVEEIMGAIPVYLGELNPKYEFWQQVLQILKDKLW